MNSPAVATNTTYELVYQQEQFFSKVLTSDELTWQKECQFAIQALDNNEFLAKTAMSQRASFQNAIINVAAIGISLNPALKHAYLVPRKPNSNGSAKVCLDISYQGLLHLAMSAGSIEWGQAKLVYENDRYVNNGVDQRPTHEQQTFGEKGKIIGVYCTVKTKSGDYLTEEMDLTALNKVQATSKAANGPWKSWPEEMMRKTVVKRASKYWPTCEPMKLAVDALNEHEGLADIQAAPQADRITQEQTEQLRSAMDMADMSEQVLCQQVRIQKLENLEAFRFEGAMDYLKSQAIKGESE